MHEDKSPSFFQLICGAEPVQTACVLHRPTQLWWRIILLLHGKPVNPSLPQEERKKRIADGFKFYAGLYRFLAVVFLLLAPVFILLNRMETGDAYSYWAAASFLAGAYLWCVSGLGYAGARSYATGQNQGTGALVAFMVMIVAFLSGFVACVSAAAHYSAWISAGPNLIGTSALFVFGIGSYMIEIIYLATEPKAETGVNTAGMS